jgi:hypothetical protein
MLPIISKKVAYQTGIRILSSPQIAQTSTRCFGSLSSVLRRPDQIRPIANIPEEIARELANTHPLPMRHEFAETPEKVTTEFLESLDIGLGKHHVPITFSDKLALRLVKMLRILPDTYFKNDHYMRSVMLETVAAGKNGFDCLVYFESNFKCIISMNSSWHGWRNAKTPSFTTKHVS